MSVAAAVRAELVMAGRAVGRLSRVFIQCRLQHRQRPRHRCCMALVTVTEHENDNDDDGGDNNHAN